jgi:excinuclease ABC subunit C
MIDPRTLQRLPTLPGAYLLKGDADQILYIGKAKSLRSRVRSYFTKDRNRGIRHTELARQATRVETIVVESEAEALILEANLIRQHRPPFNIQLRDDKRYPYIKVTVQEPFPQVYVTRKVQKDGARYLGPFTSVGPLRQALEVVKRLYTVRSCRYALPDEAPPRPCLDYHIGRCKAPCVGLQTEAEYREMIGEIVHILEGNMGSLRESVEERMREAAGALRFEEAARHRDVLAGLDTIALDQRVEKAEGGSLDVIGLARDGALGSAVLLRVRKGTLLGRESHRFTELDDETDAELLDAFLTHHYLGTDGPGLDPPVDVLVPVSFPGRKVLEEVLTDRVGRRVHVRVPVRGEKLRLVRLAASNARHLLEERVTALEAAPDRAEEILYEVQDRLGLKVVPRLIVCFDVSHTQGSELVASAVAFENAEPRKGLYRHMKIRGEWRNDDYRSMAEAVERWLGRRLAEGAPLPELIVLDGGKGQLSAVLPILQELKTPEVNLVALAKREEELFVPGSEEPLRLNRRDPVLRLLQRIRNEAHRFAITYNRKLRTRRTVRSALEEVPGVGPVRARALLTTFGSVRGIRAASEQDLRGAAGISEELARKILTHLGK